jgi:predicted nucleic acid-binding protein
MTARFADTGFFLALLDEHDQYHLQVAEYAASSADLIVTTRWVLAETANGLAASQHRAAVAEFLQAVEGDPNVKLINDSDALYRRGLELFADRSDKAWSLTDCISFVVMNGEGLREALTGDHHFRQAGFVPVFA